MRKEILGHIYIKYHHYHLLNLNLITLEGLLQKFRGMDIRIRL